MINEYAIINLENNNEYAIIDNLEYNNKKYSFVVKVSKDETFVDNTFRIGIYNELNNYFEKIENEEEFDFLMQKFLHLLNKKQKLESLLDNTKLNLNKLRVISVDNTNYQLEDSKGNIINKNLIFYTDRCPEQNDYIYMSQNIIKEKNIFQYGVINSLDKINIDEIIKVEIYNDQYFLQRYYG